MDLTAEDLIVVLDPKMLKKWLSNPIAEKLYLYSLSKAASKTPSYTPAPGYKWTDEDELVLKNVPRNPNDPNIDPTKLAEVVLIYVGTVIKNWKVSSTDDTAKQMIASIPLFVEMSKYLPHVNPDDDYDYAFRGTSFSMLKIKSFVRRTKPSDWKPTKVGGIHVPMMTYVGPAKNQMAYKPHRAVQSWSVSDEAAFSFGNTIVATPLDDTFFFDPAFTKAFGYSHEQETIHFGKSPMKVSLVIPKADYDDFRAGKDSNPWSLSEYIGESIEVEDEDGTLILPQI